MRGGDAFGRRRVRLASSAATVEAYQQAALNAIASDSPLALRLLTDDDWGG